MLNFLLTVYISFHIYHQPISLLTNSPNYRFEDIDDGPSPKSIINLMRADHFTTVTYWKAFEGRRLARDMANGTAEEGYALLPSYCYVLEQKNPGTVTTIARDRNDRFKYVFIAFGASIRGFNVMRKV